MDPDTRFTDVEVGLILTRASERQESTSAGKAVVGHGLSLSELEAAATEAGIDAAHIRSAAKEVTLRRSLGLPAHIKDSPEELAHLRVVEGQIDDAAWERIVQALRERFKRNGIATQFGAAREWVSTNTEPDGEGLIRVRIEPDGDATAVSIRRNLKAQRSIPMQLGGTLGAFAVGLGGLMQLGVGGGAGTQLPFLFGGAALVLYGVSRVLVRRWAARLDGELRAALDDIERLVGTGA